MAIAIRRSQATDTTQNRILLALGLVGIGCLMLTGIYVFVKNRLENANQQQPAPVHIPLDRV